MRIKWTAEADVVVVGYGGAGAVVPLSVRTTAEHLGSYHVWKE